MESRKLQPGCTFGILGDSYSTFQGYIPEGNACYYPRPEMVDDVLAVEDTWWHRLKGRRDMDLVINDSYSGATVCTQVRDTQPKTASFVERARRSFSFASSGGPQPDCIIVFGCTNDNWLKRTPGKLQFGHWTEADLEQVIPAYCYVLDLIARENPSTVIAAVLNTGLAPDIRDGMLRAGEHYGAVNVELTQIDKQNGHPSKLGMSQIADQVEAALF